MELISYPLHVIVISSANSWVFIGGLKLMAMSLIPIKNSLVLIADPCGTLFLILTGCDRDPFALTWIDLLEVGYKGYYTAIYFYLKEGINKFGSRDCIEGFLNIEAYGGYVFFVEE